MTAIDILTLLLVTLVWGFNFAVVKIGLAQLPPILFVSLRFFLVAALLLPFLKWPRHKRGMILLLGITLGVIHFSMFFLGVNGLDVSTGQLKHRRRASCFLRESRPRFFADRRARRQHFDASSLAAAAARSVVVDADVPAFGGRPGASIVDAAVKKYARSNSRADACVKNVSIAPPRAPQSFRKRGGVGIVVDLNGATVAARDLRRQRKVPPARHVGRIQHHTGVRIKRPRCANPDTSHRTSSVGIHLQQRVNRVRHRGEAFFRAAPGVHRRACIPCDLALCIDKSRGHFRAADIDANRPGSGIHSIGHRSKPRIYLCLCSCRAAR